VLPGRELHPISAAPCRKVTGALIARIVCRCRCRRDAAIQLGGGRHGAGARLPARSCKRREPAAPSSARLVVHAGLHSHTPFMTPGEPS